MAAAAKNKITVILMPEEFDRFDRFCAEKGFKKSTLIAKMIRELLDKEGRPEELSLFPAQQVTARGGIRGGDRP